MLKAIYLKKLSIFMAVIMMVCILTATPFTVSAAETNVFSYEYIEDNYVMITEYTGSSKSVTIPAKIDGYEVYAVDSNVFNESSNIESIKISNGIVFINSYAFANCKNLKSVSIPESVIYIGDGILYGTAYYNNSSNWLNNVLYAGKYAIKVKDNVQSVSLKHGTIGIASLAALYCNKLTAFTIPDTVKYISDAAIYCCEKMKSITLPYGLEYIGFWSVGFTGPGDYNEPPTKISDFRVVGASGTLAEGYAEYFGFKFADGSKAKSVTLNRNTLTLGVGESYTLIKTVKPSSAANCSWSSSNSSVASVNSNGKVTAKKAGTANITVKTASGLTSSCRVTVKNAPSSVKVNPTSLTLGKGETYIISESTNSGSYAWGFGWNSSNTSVATVEKASGNKAKITAKGNGTANITVKLYNGKTASCKVTVKNAPSSVSLTAKNLTLGKGETYIIAQNSNSGSYAKSFTWSSSNSSVATIEKTSGNKAKITAKGNGTATITFKTYNGKTASCKVNVKNAPASVKINPTSLTLGVGETYTISESTNSGTYANAENLKWSSSNTSVATVSKGSGNKAVVTAKGRGTANITIKLYNGKTATCKVTVKSAPTSVKLSATKLSMDPGNTYIISESSNSGSYAKNFVWSSSDPAVAAVEKTSGNKAKITAISPGTATVYVKLYNGVTASCIVTVKNNVIQGEADKEADKVVELVNAERTKQGLPGLVADADLNMAAKIRAKELVESFSHTRPNGTYCNTVLIDNEIPYGFMGENIAKGGDDVNKVMELWMNSEGHRKNILSANFNKIGVACYEYKEHVYWVHIFTD